MNLNAADQMPCDAGCVFATDLDETPKPRPATHGRYCTRCYGRVKFPMSLAAPLAEHIASRLLSSGSGDESLVKGSREGAPLPFNETAFNDVNGLYESLAYFCRYFAKRLGVKAPDPARHSWRTQNGRVKGLPANITPDAARYQTAQLSTWLDSHLADILTLIDPEELEGFTERMREIRRMADRWPLKMQPRYAAMPCSYCAGRIAIYPPSHWHGSELIACEGCGMTWTPSWYEHQFTEWAADVRAERRKANREKTTTKQRHDDHLTIAGRTVARLTAKYEAHLIAEALIVARMDVPPAGVLVTHLGGSTSVSPTHTVPAGTVVHRYEVAGGTLAAPATPIGQLK